MCYCALNKTQESNFPYFHVAQYHQDYICYKYFQRKNVKFWEMGLFACWELHINICAASKYILYLCF